MKPIAMTGRLRHALLPDVMHPDVVQRLVAEAIEPMPMSPAQFGAYIRAELTRYTALAREQKIWLED